MSFTANSSGRIEVQKKLRSLYRNVLKNSASKSTTGPSLWTEFSLSSAHIMGNAERSIHLNKYQSSLVLSDQPFDRLLLGISPIYTRTRKKARVLGINLTPALKSRPHSTDVFDANPSSVSYTPIGKELEWIANASLSEEEKILQLSRVYPFTSTIFHDLNHQILFRCLRPRPQSVDPRLYFNLVESLVIFRDFELAQELGILSRPLRALGLTYEVDLTISKANQPLKFQPWVALFFMHLMGFSKEQISSKFEKIFLSEPPFEPSIKSKEFVNDIVPNWIAKYKGRFGNRVVLPQASKVHFKIPMSALKDLLYHEIPGNNLARAYYAIFK